MDDSRYEKARKKVKEKKEFYSHLSTYLAMSVFFFLLNSITAPGHWWFYWPMLGWGLGVLFHYLDVFGIPGVGEMSADWEERAIQRELERLDQEERLDLDDRLDLDEKVVARKKGSTWDDRDLV